MNELVDRVARALWELETETDCHEWESLAAFRKAETRCKASAVIAAMREPTEAMIDVALEGHPEPDELARIDKREQWRAQIDAALSEEVKA